MIALFNPFVLSMILIVGLTIMGQSIGIAMIAGSLLYLLASGFDPSIAAETTLQGLYNGYTLLAIPLFILAADLMNIGSISDRLMRFCHTLVGRFRGGLGHVDIVASVIFSGMSGSAIADAAGMGRITINMMTKDGKYPASYAAAIVAATATIGPIIPPSIPMVLYALVSDTSIGYLFLAGVIPGLLMALAMGAVNVIQAHRNNFPVEEAVPLREWPGVTFRAFPALMLPVILLGGIYGGVMTPTEAAAVAAAYALFISVVFYRSISAPHLYGAVLSSARSTASIGILIAGALCFNFVVTRENIPDTLSLVLQSYDLSPTMFLIVVNIMLLVLGCFLEGGTVLLVIIPIFIPTVYALGIDPVHFGVVVVVNLMIGLITPPYGLLLFVVANITKSPLKAIIIDLVPFILALLVSLGIITFVPDLVLWLPRIFGYEG